MKRYALVGTGSRGTYNYIREIVQNFKDDIELVALCDLNPKRAEFAKKETGAVSAVYTDFDQMLRREKPDTVIVTTKDSTHDEFIEKALDFGCDVICEKPMTMSEDKVLRILKAEKRNGRNIRVTFNCRYVPLWERVKEVMMTGALGEILHVNLEWMLDTTHGADYFRRWHRRLENCGGLLVHKSTHHFDLVNWLIEQDPVEVQAHGALRFYGPTREKRGTNCRSCPYLSDCEFRFEGLQSPMYKGMYFDAEEADGYLRDACVFSEEIDIYDTMSLSVQYSEKALMTYSLVAYAPYEATLLSIDGTKGRLEVEHYYSGEKARADFDEFKLYDRSGNITVYRVRKAVGSHGGSDERLLKSILHNDTFDDRLSQCAGSIQGAKSALIGIAANRSIRENGRPVGISELVDLKSYEK